MQLEVVGAHIYEPDAYLPKYTHNNALLMLKFYQHTGNRKYLSSIPNVINWLEEVLLPRTYYSLNRNPAARGETTDERIKRIISALDNQKRWLIKHAMTSNPYIGDGQKHEKTNEFASTNVGDETDTSPYRDISDQEYISTPEYIRNMSLLKNETSLYFNGIDDGLIIPTIPIKGWKNFTVEVLFNPANDGPIDPRFIHFQDEEENRGTIRTTVDTTG